MLNLVQWLSFHRAHVAFCFPQFFVLGVAFFALFGVGLFGLLEFRFVLRVLVYEGLAA